jgi:HTH-type transcriptional regulator/antitoxin HigA
MGYAQPDLAKLVGRGRASEILKRKRRLTLDQIRLLQAEWHIPADLLVGKLPRTRKPAKAKRRQATRATGKAALVG